MIVCDSHRIGDQPSWLYTCIPFDRFEPVRLTSLEFNDIARLTSRHYRLRSIKTKAHLSYRSRIGCRLANADAKKVKQSQELIRLHDLVIEDYNWNLENALDDRILLLEMNFVFSITSVFHGIHLFE